MKGIRDHLDQLQSTYQDFRDDDSDEAVPPMHQHLGIKYSNPARASQHSSDRKQIGPTGDALHPDGPDDVIIHQVPEGSKSRWSHVEDLDWFFKKVYEYHQRHGFKVIALQKICELAQVGFIVLLTVVLSECVRYDVLFKYDVPPDKMYADKVKFSDVVVPLGKCMPGFRFWTWVFLLISFGFWIWKLMAAFYQVFQYWDIKSFYGQALKIRDDDLESVTWQDVQRRLVEAQSDYLMCIHKEQLTELDIYHRILRFTNYLVAMVNKNVLPVRLTVPCMNGEVFFLSKCLLWNLEFLLFKGPWAPFDKWHLKDDYKKANKRKELAKDLRRKVAVLALLNFILMPLVLLWQLLYSFFNYAELVKREPGSLGVRKWSRYARLYLRHFNEHDHELKARLNRAYKPANHYLEIFVSPLMATLARFITFVAGSVLGVIIVLSIWDEDVLNVEHILTVITVLGAIVAGGRIFIPDPNVVFCPEKVLTVVLAHIHYFPDSWKGSAHTPKVMQELSALFPYTAVYILHELLSPIITPFVLLFMLRPRASAIIDFFRNFTVEVVGVGDVCSFAQMDVRRHGDPQWQQATNGATTTSQKDVYTKAEDGKTEMSLVNFTLTNPDWKAPQESENFICRLRAQAEREAEALPTLTEDRLEENMLFSSLNSLEAVEGGAFREVAVSLLAESCLQRRQQTLSESGITQSSSQGAPLEEECSSSLLRSVHQGLSSVRRRRSTSSHFLPPPTTLMMMTTSSSLLTPPPNLRQDLRRLGLEYTAADMSLSALFMHEIHHKATGGGGLQQRYPRRGNGPSSSRNVVPVLYPPRRTSLFNELEEEEESIPLVAKINSSSTTTSSSESRVGSSSSKLQHREE